MTKFKEQRHADILKGLRTAKSVADYVMAAHEAKAMKDESLRTFAQKKDLNAFMIERWKGYLEKKAKDPMFVEWAEKQTREVADKLAQALVTSEPFQAADSPVSVPLADVECEACR